MTAPELSTAKLALEHLFERIVAETLERVPPADVGDPPPVACHFGWRESSMQDNQGVAGAARVVLQPGDVTGKVGDLVGAKLPGRNPPPLATMPELATLFLWAQDPDDDTELGQWRATRRLHDLVMPIVIRNFRGRWKQLSKEWVKPTLERRFGAELRIVISVESMIPDDVVPQAPGGTVTNVETQIAALPPGGSGVPIPC